MELEITWKRAIHVWWAYLWRNIIVVLCTMVGMFIFGLIVGFISKALGYKQEVIKTTLMVFGFIIGFCSSIYPIKMILGKEFGDFRIVLVSRSPSIKSAINP